MNISGANDTLFEVKDLTIGDSASFRCIVTNKAGSDTSENAVLKIFENDLAPKIKKQPENKEAETGDTARFSIISDGTNLKYQWYENDEKIDKAVLSTFETGPVSSEDSGKIFYCIVSNDKGEEASSKVTLTVKSIAKPIITEHPKDTAVTVGEPAMFKANADGRSLTYQWYMNSVKIDGQNKKVYSFKAEMPIHGSEFKCRVIHTSDKSVYADSKTLTLKVEKKQEKPSIVKDLSTLLSVEDGKQVRLEIEAECTTSDIEYQWYEDGSKLSGENKRSYTFTATTYLNNNKYKCRVLNATTKTLYTDSKELKLTVKQRPKPTIKISNPKTGTVVAINKNIILKSDITGSNVAAKYYLDSESKLLGEAKADGSYSWTPKQAGIHKIIGKISDSYGVAIDTISVITVAGMKPIPPVNPQFWMDSVEVTQKKFEQALRKNYSAFIGENLPIGSITWYDALLYCNALSKSYGLDTCYSYNSKTMSGDTCKKLNGLVFNSSKISFCLPKLSEWKTAYFAGGSYSQDYYWGNDTTDIATINQYAWSSYNCKVNGNKTTHIVAGKKPNNWGLYDMSGNAFEWCWDIVGSDGHYAIGGDYYWGADYLRPNKENWTYGYLSLSAAGFRVILHVPKK